MDQFNDELRAQVVAKFQKWLESEPIVTTDADGNVSPKEFHTRQRWIMKIAYLEGYAQRLFDEGKT